MKDHTMKTTIIAAIIAALALSCHAQTQRFPNVSYFATNVFLFDAPTVPLHTRLTTQDVDAALSGKLSDAPDTDGPWARQSNDWVEVDISADVADWYTYPQSSGLLINQAIRTDEIAGWSTNDGRTVGLTLKAGPAGGAPTFGRDILLQPSAWSSGPGSVLLVRNAALRGQGGDTLISSTLTNDVRIFGYDAFTGGQAGGSVFIRGGVGVGLPDGTVVISNAVHIYGNAGSLTNFPSTLQRVSAYQADITNYWRIVSTAPTGATASGTNGDLHFSGTNGYARFGNAWHRFNTVTNWP